MYEFSPEFVDALIDAIDRRRAERQASHGVEHTQDSQPSDHKLMEQAVQRALMVAYRNARRFLSVAQTHDIFDDAERRIARLKSSSSINRPDRDPEASAQALAEMFQVVFGDDRGGAEQE